MARIRKRKYKKIEALIPKKQQTKFKKFQEYLDNLFYENILTFRILPVWTLILMIATYLFSLSPEVIISFTKLILIFLLGMYTLIEISVISSTKDKYNLKTAFILLLKKIVLFLFVAFSIHIFIDQDITNKDQWIVAILNLLWSLILSRYTSKIINKIKNMVIDNDNSVENIKLINTLTISFLTAVSTILAVLLTIKQLLT